MPRNLCRRSRVMVLTILVWASAMAWGPTPSQGALLVA
jgi:hypothetical protein